MAESIIVRIQSPDGMKKISSTKHETAAAFLKKVAKEFGFSSNGFSVYLNRNKTGEILSQNKALSLLKIKHGDMLFLYPSSAGPSSENMDTAQPHTSSSFPSFPSSSSSSSLSRSHSAPQIPEDDIDQYLSKQEGKIYRNRDPQLCRHGAMGKCVHCVPLEKYRHVDNIMFENHTIADRFLDFWRKTGNQRMGYLYGRYTEHKDIPLGIRAEVAAIYEPPQVGWIFTDLLSEDTRIGTVRYTRNKDSYFLSAEECITAGHFQNQQANMCRLSPDGHFGSKFVTVVATGGPDNQVHFEGYQVSNQCMALVRDECLLPCRDAPELGYAKESSTEQYVPDVFYKLCGTAKHCGFVVVDWFVLEGDLKLQQPDSSCGDPVGKKEVDKIKVEEKKEERGGRDGGYNN